jgi:hypothetical protein
VVVVTSKDLTEEERVHLTSAAAHVVETRHYDKGVLLSQLNEQLQALLPEGSPRVA